MVKSTVPASAESPAPARSFFIGALLDAFGEILSEQRQSRDFGALFAVRGTTLFEYTEEDATLPTHGCLLPEEIMYGSFRGAAPRVFPHVPAKRLIETLNTGGDLDPKPVIIGTMCLEAVEICRDNDGWGQVDRRFDEVLLPITNRDIQIFRGYPRS